MKQDVFPVGQGARKRRSQWLAFGIFKLLSYSIVLILFAILGFIIYKGAGVISWEFLTTAPRKFGVKHLGHVYDGWRYMAGHCRYFLSDGGQCAVRFSGGGNEWHLYERVCAERQAGALYPDDDQ